MEPDYLKTELEVNRELTSGEKLLWSGRPRQGICLRPSDTAAIPFSLLWCGFAIFWETMAFRGNAPFFFKLWGVPFVLIGLYLVFGRFFGDAYARTRTYYAVTSDRIIIISGFFSRQVKSLPLRTLADITVNERADGTGTISFGPQYPYPYARQGWPSNNRYAVPSFDLIDRVKEVNDVIRHAQQSTNHET